MSHVFQGKVCRRARDTFWDIRVPKMTALGDSYAFGARTGLRPQRRPTARDAIAPTMPLRLSLSSHFVSTCALAQTPTKQENLGYPGVARQRSLSRRSPWRAPGKFNANRGRSHVY